MAPCFIFVGVLNFLGAQAAFQFAGKNKVYLIEGSSTSIDVTYTSGDPENLTAVVNADTDVTINGTINTLHKNGTIEILASDVSSLGYGTYKMVLNLTGNGVQENITAALFFEKNMTGLKVNSPVVETLVNADTVLSASLLSGSGTTVEWISNDNSVVTYGKCNGSIDTIEGTATFPSAQNYTVTVLSINSLGQGLSDQVTVVVLNPVEGFSLTKSPSVVAVNEEVTISLLLDGAIRLPMGNIYSNISYGDGDEENTTYLNNDINSLLGTGVKFKHSYTKQGNYSVSSRPYTSLSHQSINIVALVWNAITLPSAVSYIEVGKSGLFYDDYNSNTPFRYYIMYGDNRTVHSPSNIVENNLPINTTAWDTSYDTAGVYQIELDGWNSVYHKNCKYEIRVQNPVPELELIPNETSPLTPFAALDAGVNFTLTLKDSTSLPPTNMSCKFCFDSGNDCSGNIDIELEGTNSYTINHVYTVGIKDISVNCSNKISYRITETRIEVIPGIEGFEVTNGYILNLMVNNSTTSEFKYTQGTMLSASMTVHAQEAITIDGSVDVNNKKGYVTLTENNIPNVYFGQYRLTLELRSAADEVHVITLALLYEEPIEGFLVEEETDLILTEDPTKFFVTFNKGSNMEVEIVVNEAESILLACNGTVRQIETDYSYLHAVSYNVTSVARNSISCAESPFQMITAVQRVKGFNITTNDNLIDSYSYAQLKISLDSINRLPMHDLTLYLNYGDNDNSGQISFDEVKISTSLSQVGYAMSHQYTGQGNFSIVGSMKSNLSSLPLVLDIYVWDNITNVRLHSNTSAKVDEKISFYFLNAPHSGFEYLIDFGDGAYNTSNPNIVMYDYVDTTFIHSYSSPDVYTVNVRMWNPFFVVQHSYFVIIQHPIVYFYLSPRPPIQYPLPDGKVQFKINMTSNNPDPTNVTCQFSYENGIVKSNDSVTITYTKSVKRTYTYKTDGTKSIQILCSNIVSGVELTTEVDIKSVELDDFTFIYEHVVPMNMTPNATDVPVEVPFNIRLFECVKFPPSVNFTLDYGDGTDLEIIENDNVLHIYELRKIYEIRVVIKNSTTQTNKSMTIKLGSVDFNVSSYLAGIGITTILFQMTGIGLDGQYELYPELPLNSSVQIKNQLQENTFVRFDKIYNDYGKFEPKIIAINENFTEFLYFPEPIVADYNMSVMVIDLPNKLRMPDPGKLNVTASLISGTKIPLPSTSCTYDMQDFINYTVVSITQNITEDEPLIFTFTYLTLGAHDVTVNCSNFYDKFGHKAVVEVTNKCFTIEGIFDRQYARPTNPMRVYTTENFDLTNRMGVHCSNESVKFYWKINRYHSENNKEEVFKNDIDPSQETRGAYRCSKGKFPPGLYEFNLNVSLTTTWIPERTYLLFVQPPPVAFVGGGFQRTSKLSSRFSTIDALKSSYDVAIGYGGNENLNFTWTCYETPAASLDDLAEKYERQTYGSTPCSIGEVSRGIGNLTLEKVQGYIITVNVSLDTVFADYTQLIMVSDGNFPDIYIRCILNCDIKYAVTAKSIWEVVCVDCVGKPTYKWDLQVQNGTGYWSDVVDLQSTTGVLQKSFDILGYALLENTWYRITVNVTDNYGVGTAKWRFITNLRPYGGCCKAVNESVKGRPPKVDEVIQEDMPVGKAFSTKFAIYCFDWKDEGDRYERDEEADSRLIIPIMYEYVMKQYFNSSSNHDLSRETSIYKGGESTARDLRLPAGNPENDYLLTLYVKIIDRFGDYAKVNWTVNVTKDESFDPSDPERANRLLDEHDDNSNTTKAGGNDAALLRLITSTASMYRDTQLGNKSATNTDDASDITYYAEETSDELQTIIQEKTKEFISEISALVPANSTLTVLPADAQLVASTLDECISNPDAITQTASEGVTNTTYELMLNVQRISQANPYPMSELGAIQGATLDVVDVLSKNLLFYENITIEDTNSTLTLEIVEADLRTYLLYHPEDIDKYPVNQETIQKLYDKRTAIREKQKETGSSTEKTTDKLFGTIDTVNDVNSRLVAYGQGVNEVKVDNLYLSIEKDSVGNFLNKSRLERNGINIDFENETFTNVTAEHLDVQVSVLNKSPLIHAKGASKIHENIVKFTVRDDNDNEVKIPLKMTIKNNGKTYFTSFDSSIFANEQNGLMHFRVQLQDHNDAFIVYILPDGFDETTTETYNLTLYATSQITSVVGQYEFEEYISPLSWTPYGFKIFIPSQTFPQGDVILSLKAQKAPSNNTESESLSRRKRSTSNLSSPTTNNQTLANISVAVVTTGCRAYDDSTSSWTPNGCVVLPHSTINDTVCSCPPTAGTIFASSFFVPNLIDFHSVWGKFDVNNAAVYGTLIAVFVLYIIGVIILRRYDKKDKIKWLPMLLCDNKKSDNYFYLISVFTGLRPGAGTASNISFILGGEDGDSGVRLLSDGKSKGLESKTVKSFVMATPECLSGLTYIRIWHDNSGDGNEASWYLHKVIVDDLQNKNRFVFLCDRWLAIDLDDGMVDRLCPVVDKENAGFEVLFSQQTRSNVTDNHLWLSIVVRPQRSLFTRVQRLSCLLSLLLLTMITNAMFFQSASEETITPDTVRIGSLRLSMKSLYISMAGILITVPPIMAMTYLFKNSKTRKTVTKDAKAKSNESNKLEPISEEEENDSTKDVQNVSQEIVMEELAKYPYWVVYIAWVVVALSVLVPAFFMVLYSMEWGKEKSEEWLTTFVLSFIESLLIVDPMKVLLIALLIAWLVKKPAEDVNYNIDLNSVRDKCQSCAENNSNQFTSFRMEIMSKSGPPVEDALEGQRMQRLKEKIAQAAFIDLLLQILFAVVVFSISYVNRDERAYHLKKNIDDHLFRSTKTHYGFSKVNSKHSFFNWTKDILIPFTYPDKHFNDKTLGAQYTLFVADLSNVRVGMVRLRQVRGNEDDCMHSALTDGHVCVPKYSTDKENKSSMIAPASLVYSSGAWTYISAESIWGIPIRGLYNTYNGGGFIHTFHSQKVTTLNTIAELETHRWIDRHTRAVFVEFTLYNPNINLYSYSIYLVEFSEIGGAFHWADTQCFRASTITDATGAFAIIFYVIFLIIIIVITVKLVNKFRRDGCRKTFKNLWNVLDIVLCFFSYTGCVVWVCKYIYTRSAMDKLYDNRNEFINFQHIVVWEYIFTCILGVLCFASTLRILSALGYNKRLTEVADVLRHGAKPIGQFAIVFMCVFLNFVGFGYLLFGSTVYEYRNFFISSGSLTNTLIGRNSLDSMIRAAPNFAELYFFVYVFFVIFTLMTMFAAILNDSISEVRNKQADDTIGIMHIVKSVVKDILGVAGIHMKNETSLRLMEKYKAKDEQTNSIDVNNIMGLIRETLDDFKFQEKGKQKDDEFPNTAELETEMIQRSRTPLVEFRPATACNVKIVLPDGKDVRDNDDFYDFYKTYI